MSTAGRRRARVLLDRADADALALVTLADHPEVADEILGFHAQQAVEKLLKAVLAARDVRAPRSHSVAELFDLVAESGMKAPVGLRRAEELSQFAVQFRYEPLGQDEALDRHDVLALVREIRDWALGRLTAGE